MWVVVETRHIFVSLCSESRQGFPGRPTSEESEKKVISTHSEIHGVLPSEGPQQSLPVSNEKVRRV